MPVFSYKARAANGAMLTGRLEGSSADAVAIELSGKGSIPVSITEVKAKVDFIEHMSDAIGAAIVSPQELVIFCRQMFSVTRAGVPIVRGMRGLADSSQNRKFAVVLDDLADCLEQGMDLTAAMRRHPRVFSHLFISIIQVGESSGTLDEAFNQLSQYLSKDIETQKQVKTAFRYPTFVLIAVCVALTVINLLVIPEFAKFFARFDTQLPLPTRMLIVSSNFFINYWHLMILVASTSLIGLRQYIRTEAGAYKWGQFKLKLPIVGDIINRASLARYTRSFSMMAKAGVPLVQALSLCSYTIDNPFLGKKIQQISAGIERGESLLQTHAQSGMFTPLVLQMVAVGEESGTVEELLLEVARFYEDEVDYELSTIGARIEPLLISLMAMIVLVLALGIFLPMWQIGSVVQG